MSFEYLTCNLIARRIRHDTLDGRDHLVVPTVMAVEGVLNGSIGALFYPGAELSKTPSVWDHKPLVVNHPADGRACRPDVLRTRKIGVILNTHWEAPKLRTEAWIDVAACKRVDKRIIENLEASKQIEVSTGLFVDVEPQSGQFGAKAYKGIARNYRPDHLAVLPDTVGACSVADGAGLLQLNSSRHIVTVIDRSPTYAVINFSDNTFYEIKGDERFVSNRMREALEGKFVPPPADCIDPMTYFNDYVANYSPPTYTGPVLMDRPAPMPEESEEPYVMPTMNWKTGQIERNGKPIEAKQPQAYYPIQQSQPENEFAGFYDQDFPEANEEPYLMPKLDFSDRLVGNQPNTSPASRLTNDQDLSEENEEPYVMPKMDFSDRRVR